jgi:hypothetical protein
MAAAAVAYCRGCLNAAPIRRIRRIEVITFDGCCNRGGIVIYYTLRAKDALKTVQLALVVRRL